MVTRGLHSLSSKYLQLRVPAIDPIWTKKALGEWTSRHYVPMVNQ
jgi:hypothetical protein